MFKAYWAIGVEEGHLLSDRWCWRAVQ